MNIKLQCRPHEDAIPLPHKGTPLVDVLAPYLDGDESDHLERVLANLGECVDSQDGG